MRPKPAVGDRGPSAGPVGNYFANRALARRVYYRVIFNIDKDIPVSMRDTAPEGGGHLVFSVHLFSLGAEHNLVAAKVCLIETFHVYSSLFQEREQHPFGSRIHVFGDSLG